MRLPQRVLNCSIIQGFVPGVQRFAMFSLGIVYENVSNFFHKPPNSDTIFPGADCAGASDVVRYHQLNLCKRSECYER